MSIKPHGTAAGQTDADGVDPSLWIHVKPAFAKLSNVRQHEIIKDWFDCWHRVCRKTHRYAALDVQITPEDIYGMCSEDDPCELNSDPDTGD